MRKTHSEKVRLFIGTLYPCFLMLHRKALT